jgi:hypothetical protein
MTERRCDQNINQRKRLCNNKMQRNALGQKISPLSPIKNKHQKKLILM